MLRLAVAGACLVLGASGKPDGTCGYECSSDAECGGCGSAGKCSCPDGQNWSFPQIHCSCVSAPDGAPASVNVSVEDTQWPLQWMAKVEGWVYGDFSHKAAPGQGTFRYDAVLGRTRGDWTPYTNQKDCTQVWIADVSGQKKSQYYVKAGPLCLTFPISDPGAGGMAVGVERPDWVKRCSEAGYAKYVGREQVNYEGKDVWVDHWSCHLDYAAVNQTIVFQNWHSLGLDGVPKGLPLRVTGGNSAPSPTKGSPRLSTVWYTDFKTGDGVTKPEDFVKPSWFCIPVGLEETESFFGHPVTQEHVQSPDFQKRAHFLPHAKPGARDLARARRPKPSLPFLGESFGHAMRKLNGLLTKEEGLRVRPCQEFSLEEVHAAQRLLFHARSAELHGVYHQANDTRRMAHSSLSQLDAEHGEHAGIATEAPELAAKLRDGACHEAVMWYVHHLSAEARDKVKDLLTLPLLPEVMHDEEPRQPAEAPRGEQLAQKVHSRYTEQVSCAVCHVVPTSGGSPELIV